MRKNKKEIKLIYMVSEEELNRRFALAVNEYFKNYTDDFSNRKEALK